MSFQADVCHFKRGEAHSLAIWLEDSFVKQSQALVAHVEETRIPSHGHNLGSSFERNVTVKSSRLKSRRNSQMGT